MSPVKILLTPCFSMRSYTRDLWLISRDGHFTKLCAWSYYIKELFGDVEFDMLVPAKSDVILTGAGGGR